MTIMKNTDFLPYTIAGYERLKKIYGVDSDGITTDRKSVV